MTPASRWRTCRQRRAAAPATTRGRTDRQGTRRPSSSCQSQSWVSECLSRRCSRSQHCSSPSGPLDPRCCDNRTHTWHHAIPRHTTPCHPATSRWAPRHTAPHRGPHDSYTAAPHKLHVTPSPEPCTCECTCECTTAVSLTCRRCHRGTASSCRSLWPRARGCTCR
jgi:hypothetical protein